MIDPLRDKLQVGNKQNLHQTEAQIHFKTTLDQRFILINNKENLKELFI